MDEDVEEEEDEEEEEGFRDFIKHGIAVPESNDVT